jgi:hypothetical protein
MLCPTHASPITHSNYILHCDFISASVSVVNGDVGGLLISLRQDAEAAAGRARSRPSVIGLRRKTSCQLQAMPSWMSSAQGPLGSRF